MHITYKGDYALKAMLYLARAYDGGVVPIQEIARRGDMPVKFLEQVLQLLNRGGFVKSKRGTKGGYSLALPPEKITLGDVIRFIDGPIEPIGCVSSRTYQGCKGAGSCALRKVMLDIKKAVCGIVDNVTFKQLLSKK